MDRGAGWEEIVESVSSSSQFAATGTAKDWRGTNSVWTYTFATGFSFTLYGTTYASVKVSSNGFLHFAGPDTSGGDENSTEELVRNVRIAPLWDNLSTVSPGNIDLDQSIPGQVTIRWAGVVQGTTNPVNFSVTLFSDGSFRFDYGAGNTGLTPTIGVSAGNGQALTLAGYNGSGSLTQANSLVFSPQPGLTYFDIGAFEFQGNSDDNTPPAVESVSNLPASGGETAFAFSSIQIQFSEALDVISARSVANYRLIGSGGDESFADGNEVVFQVSPSYAYGSDTVNLDFRGGGASRRHLSPDPFRDRDHLRYRGQRPDGDAGQAGSQDYVHYFTIDRSSNHAPVAAEPTGIVDEDQSVLIFLSGTDADGDTLTYSITGNPLHGTLSGFGPAHRRAPIRSSTRPTGTSMVRTPLSSRWTTESWARMRGPFTSR